MKRTTGLMAGALLGAALVSGAPSALAQASTKAGAACGATSETATPDNAVEPKSGRKFVLQYPCDLKQGEKVVLVLNIHGAGSSSQYQHRYFPAGDLAQKYRLVVATPTAAAAMPGRVWRAEADDQFLHDLTDLMFTEFGKANIKSFWLSGHSQGGATSARIVCSDYFKTKVDGFFSLSGGRQGGRTERNPQYNAPAPGAPVPAAVPSQGPGPAPAPGAAPATPPAPAADGPTTCDYSHISAYGEWEVAAMPDKSTIADKFGCTSRTARPDIIDEKAGYVWDPGRQNPTRIGWGRQQRPGTAKMWVYEGCKDGRVVADVLRIDKGHTEGLEASVTEEIVKLMVSAKGGRAQGEVIDTQRVVVQLSGRRRTGAATRSAALIARLETTATVFLQTLGSVMRASFGAALVVLAIGVAPLASAQSLGLSEIPKNVAGAWAVDPAKCGAPSLVVTLTGELYRFNFTLPLARVMSLKEGVPAPQAVGAPPAAAFEPPKGSSEPDTWLEVSMPDVNTLVANFQGVKDPTTRFRRCNGPKIG